MPGRKPVKKKPPGLWAACGLWMTPVDCGRVAAKLSYGSARGIILFLRNQEERNMASKVVSLDAHVHRVWTEYLAARERADETKAVADGIAAGRAWRRWLDLFTAEDQRQKMDGTSR